MHLVLIRVEGREGEPTASDKRVHDSGPSEAEEGTVVVLEWPALHLRGNYGLNASALPPGLATVAVCGTLASTLGALATDACRGLTAAAFTVARIWPLPGAKPHSWATSGTTMEVAIGAAVYRAPHKTLGVFALVGPQDAATHDEFVVYPAWITALAARIHEQVPTMAFSLREWVSFNQVPLWHAVRSHVEHHHMAWAAHHSPHCPTTTAGTSTWPLYAHNHGLSGLSAPFFTLRFQRYRAAKKKQHQHQKPGTPTLRTDATTPASLLHAEASGQFHRQRGEATTLLVAEWCNVHDEPTGAPVPSTSVATSSSNRHADPSLGLQHRPPQRCGSQQLSTGAAAKVALVDDALDSVVALCTPFFPRPRSLQTEPQQPHLVRSETPKLREAHPRAEQNSPLPHAGCDSDEFVLENVAAPGAEDVMKVVTVSRIEPTALDRVDRYAALGFQPQDSVSRSANLVVAEDEALCSGGECHPNTAVMQRSNAAGARDADEDTVLVVPREFDDDPCAFETVSNTVCPPESSVGTGRSSTLPHAHDAAIDSRSAPAETASAMPRGVRLLLVQEETILHYRCDGRPGSSSTLSANGGARGKDTLAVEGAVRLRWTPPPPTEACHVLGDDVELFQRLLPVPTGHGGADAAAHGGTGADESSVEVVASVTLNITIHASWCCPGDVLKTDAKQSSKSHRMDCAREDLREEEHIDPVVKPSDMAPVEVDSTSSSDDDDDADDGDNAQLCEGLNDTFPGTWTWHIDDENAGSPAAPRRTQGGGTPSSATVRLVLQQCRRLPSHHNPSQSALPESSALPLDLRIASYVVRPTVELKRALRASSARSRLSETQRAAVAVRSWRPLQLRCRWALERPKRQVNLNAVGHLFKCSVDWSEIARMSQCTGDENSSSCELRFLCLTLRPWVPPTGSFVASGSSHSSRSARSATADSTAGDEDGPHVRDGHDRGFPLACVAKPVFDIQRLKKTQVAICGWRNLLSTTAGPPRSETHRTVAARFAYRARGGKRGDGTISPTRENNMAEVVEQLRQSQRVYLSFGCRGCFSGTRVVAVVAERSSCAPAAEMVLQQETRGEYVVDCVDLDDEKSRASAASPLAKDEAHRSASAAVAASPDDGTSPSVLASVEGLLLSTGASIEDDEDDEVFALS